MVVPFCKSLQKANMVSQEVGAPIQLLSKELLNWYYTNKDVPKLQFREIQPDCNEADVKYRSLAQYLTRLRKLKAQPVSDDTEDEEVEEDRDFVDLTRDYDDPNAWIGKRNVNLKPLKKPSKTPTPNPQKPACIIISVFNYKGGVGKTSCVISTASALAGTRVHCGWRRTVQRHVLLPPAHRASRAACNASQVAHPV